MKPTEVSSLDDPALSCFKALRDRDLRVEFGAYIVESPRVVRRFLRAVARGPYEARGVLLTPEHCTDLSDELAGLPEDVPVFVAPLEVMIELSGYRFHAGALAIGERPDRSPSLEDLLEHLPAKGSLTLLIAEGVSNMDNIGAILRDAAAFGVDGVLFGEGCSDPLLRKAIRVSMGRVFNVEWAMCNDIEHAIQRLASEAGIQSIALENLPTATPLGDMVWHDRTAIVVGNEGHGLRQTTIDACAAATRIPSPANLPVDEQAGGSDELSLNVSVATAIALYARTATPSPLVRERDL